MITTTTYRGSRGAAATRRALLAVPLLLAGCGATRLAPLDGPPRGRVLLLRGLANVFSTGLNVLTATLRRAGFDASVHNHVEAAMLAQAMLRAEGHGGLARPFAVIGHSFGADEAVRLATRLRASGLATDLVVTFDPTVVSTVPASARLVVNYYQEADVFPRRLEAAPGFDGRLENRAVAGETHLTIEKNLRLHAEVLALLQALAAPAATAGR